MSSFANLRALPVDWVKLDGRFVRELATNNVDQATVRAMHDIARAQGKLTVAEFVEDAEALSILRALGVDLAQGYYLGRPSLRRWVSVSRRFRRRGTSYGSSAARTPLSPLRRHHASSFALRVGSRALPGIRSAGRGGGSAPTDGVSSVFAPLP